jgi:SOS response regulatory protein OraA/RecX
MSEFLAKFSGGEMIALVAVMIGPVVAIVAVVASQWRRVRIVEMEAALKQQMLDKGMSAAEIEKVMTASSNGVASISSTGNDAIDKAALAQRMVDNGYEGADIERVLRAYEQPPAQEKHLAGKVG